MLQPGSLPVPAGLAALAVAILLALPACTSPRSYELQPQVDRAPCSYYKVGEVRGVTWPEVQGAMRRYGGDFVRSLPDQPGGNPQGVTTYSAEIFRYEDPQCRRR